MTAKVSSSNGRRRNCARSSGKTNNSVLRGSDFLLSELIEPEIVLPGQLTRIHSGLPTSTWLRKIMLAQLVDAARIIRNVRQRPTRLNGRKYERRSYNATSRTMREVIKWIQAEDDQYPFSFVTICHVLDLSEDKMRRLLLGDTAFNCRMWRRLTGDNFSE